jgi:ABC-2 type transport system permease protein
MRRLAAALAVEGRKTMAARITAVTTVFLAFGIGAIAAGMTVAARNGNPQVLAKLGPAASLEGWDRLLAIVTQITAAAAVVGFGVLLSWIVGREFTEGTAPGLFALPVPRAAIASAKLLVYLLWTIAVAVILVATVGIAGVLVGLSAPSSDVLTLLLRLMALTMLSAMIAVPAAWAATLGRGILAGIATTAGLVVIGQVMAVSGSGAWLPLTAPALWAINPGSVTPTQLSLVAIVPALFGFLTVRAWATLQLDR